MTSFELHNACRNGDVESLQKLIVTSDLNLRDQHQRTPLHLAAWAGQTVSLTTQNQHNACTLSVCLRVSQNVRSGTAIPYSQWFFQEIVKILLAHHVQLTAGAADDMNALHFCAMKGHIEPAKLILTAGEEIHRPMFECVCVCVCVSVC